jgi:TnpA family transposase
MSRSTQKSRQNRGEETTSSSDGQRFKTAGHSGDRGNINPKYGRDPGVQFYTHIFDQYAPFHTKIINVGVRDDATYVLDRLLYTSQT